MSLLQIPPPDSRLIAYGSNGSGKSQAILTFLRVAVKDPRFDRVLVIDSKEEIELPGYVVVKNLSSWRWKFYRKIIYRPDDEHKNAASFTRLFRSILNRQRKLRNKRKPLKPYLIFCDEGLYLSKMGTSVSRALGDIAIVGRSLKIGLWMLSQRPRSIPVEIRSEAWYVYVFALQYQDDAKEISNSTKGTIPFKELLEPRDDFGFWEIVRSKGGGRQEIRYRKPIRLDTGI